MATTAGKMVYRLAEGGADMVSLLGGKGAHACEMARIGIPVPPGFVITTETSLEYFRLGRRFPDGLWDDIVEHIHANPPHQLVGGGDRPRLRRPG